jgi:hypothetical protein
MISVVAVAAIRPAERRVAAGVWEIASTDGDVGVFRLEVKCEGG